MNSVLTSKGFRDLKSKYELLYFSLFSGSLERCGFIKEAYNLVADMEQSGDPRVRLFLIPRVERDIREVWWKEDLESRQLRGEGDSK